MRRIQFVNVVASLAGVALAGCGDSSGPNRRPVSVSFSSQAPASPLVTADASSFDVTVTVGANTIVITKAQLVLRDIKLKTTATMTCSDDDSVDDDCDEITLAPQIVDLPLTTSGVTSVTASIPEGTYREIEFKIHKPEDDNAADLAFKTANPTFANISIRVEGTFNGQAFVFTSEISEKAELEFSPPVVINADNQNVTVQVDVSSWFKVGGQVVNPATANKGGANENVVKTSIHASLHVLEDDDRNGH